MSHATRLKQAGIFALLLAVSAQAMGQSGPSHVVTQDTMDQWKQTESNWGRWGPDDQKGTLNLITPQVRESAAREVRTGTSISLAREIIPTMFDPAAAPQERPPAVQQRMLTAPPRRPDGSTDSLTIAAHGYTVTHFDALGHHLFGGRMYNGFPASEHLSMEHGLTRGSLASAAEGVFTRGVLIDIPRLKGVPYIEPGTPIFVEDLEAWERRTGIRIGSGDAVFIRTGRWEREAAVGPWDIARSAAGLDASVIPWLRQRDIALIGSESALSVVPFPATTTLSDPDDYLPVHNFALVALGMPIIDNTDLSELAREADRLDRYTFLLTVAPIRVRTGTGAPVNPIATF